MQQVYTAEIAKERQSIEAHPLDERQEMRVLLEQEGINAEDAETIADILWKHHNAFVTTMVQKELGIEPDPPGTPRGERCPVCGIFLPGRRYSLISLFFPAWRDRPSLFDFCNIARTVLYRASQSEICALALSEKRRTGAADWGRIWHWRVLPGNHVTPCFQSTILRAKV